MVGTLTEVHDHFTGMKAELRHADRLHKLLPSTLPLELLVWAFHQLALRIGGGEDEVSATSARALSMLVGQVATLHVDIADAFRDHGVRAGLPQAPKRQIHASESERALPLTLTLTLSLSLSLSLPCTCTGAPSLLHRRTAWRRRV